MPSSYSDNPHLRGVKGMRNRKGEQPMGRSTGNINANARGGNQMGPKTAADIRSARMRGMDKAESKGGGGCVPEGGISGGWRSWKTMGM